MPNLEFGGTLTDYPDEPLLYFKGIPFFAVSGYTLGGSPEPAIHYLEYALKVGRWRNVKYQVMEEAELKQVAEALIGQYTDRVAAKRHLRRWVEFQIGPPHPPVAARRRSQGIPDETIHHLGVDGGSPPE